MKELENKGVKKLELFESSFGIKHPQEMGLKNVPMAENKADLMGLMGEG